MIEQSNKMTKRAGVLRPEERRERIIQIVLDCERISVGALAEALGASRETIRRDLSELSQHGRLRKFHGGALMATLNPLAVEVEGPFQTRLSENSTEKRAIARRAIQLFASGDTLFVDTGTTTLLFAEELAKASGLTIITNSASIAALAARGESATTFAIGGQYRAGGAECLGPMAVEQVGSFRAGHAVLTVGSIEQDGFFDFDPAEAEIARAMIARARCVTVLADSSKYRRGALVKIAPLECVQRIVSNSAPPDDIATALSRANVQIILAE